MKKKHLLFLLLVPVTLILGSRLKGRWYYLTSTLVILETMVPFFLAFERRKPQAREMTTIAVLCALATVSRVAILLPHFKPTTAIVILTGMALGAEAGFMTGAVTAFASNFFLSQGPWTPWQMLGFGVAGFLGGWLFHRKRPRLIPLALFGFFVIVLVVGPLLDCSTLFTTGGKITLRYVLAVFGAGLATNVVHGLACALTLLLLTKPFLQKLDRLCGKYGILP